MKDGIAAGQTANAPRDAMQRPYPERVEEILRVAKRLYAQRPDWLDFFRETLGIGGMASQLIRDAEEQRQFERSAAYSEIQRMVSSLRANRRQMGSPREVQKMITVRLPESLYHKLQEEANSHHMSLNRFCISRLLGLMGSASDESVRRPRQPK